MTQSSPMDFEKEAREIAQTISGMPDPGCFEARDLILWFARRAYTAGQKDMRESCALVVEAFPKEAGDRADIVNRDLRLATGIRMHPILSPDHEKVG